MNNKRKVMGVVPIQVQNGVYPSAIGGKRRLGSTLLIQNGGIHGQVGSTFSTTPTLMNNCSRARTGVPNKCFTVISDVLEPNKQFSSTTIVNGTDTEPNTGITTLHIPILGLEPTPATVDITPCESALGLPLMMETMEVAVEESVSENNEIETIHIDEYTPFSSTVGLTGHNSNSQPMVIASTDSQGNCFVTLQENQVFNTPNICRRGRKPVLQEVTEIPHFTQEIQTVQNVQSTSRSHIPTVTKVVSTRHVGTRPFIRCGRSRMIADQFTSIPVAEFKSQLNDTSDIVGKLDIAPCTKRLMNHLRWKGIGKLFASPGQRIMSTNLLKIFTRHLKTRLTPAEEAFDDMQLLPVGYKPEVDPSKIKRITRRRRYPEAEEYQRKLLEEQMQQSLQTYVSENHPQIQAVILENSGAFKQENQENLQVLVDAAENGSYPEDGTERVVNVYGNEDINDNSIIVIHDGQEGNEGTAYTQQNIEVLLAAAAESGINTENFQQVIICQPDSSESILPGTSSIIIVPNDALTEAMTETVISS